ncbi:MAG: hypothetical protein VCA34_01130, partial [Roseibacillus sp.]
AYVYDENRDFESKLNREMVNLYPLIECGDCEIAEVKSLIEKHVTFTDSVRGRNLLADWDKILPLFFKVLPADYERVLNAVKRAEESGLEGDAVILAAFEENAKVGN